MAVVCPTITAYSYQEYQEQLDKLKPFADRLHIDITDGHFTDKKSVSLEEISWPSFLLADIHLMSTQPMDYLDQLIALKPNMVIIHYEAKAQHMFMAAQLHNAGIKAGLALLQDTSVDSTDQIMHSFDQVLVFSGHLGSQGGQADLRLLSKVRQIRSDHPTSEIAWDGGINDQNAKHLADAEVDVLNVGSYIMSSPDPKEAYAKIVAQVRGQ